MAKFELREKALKLRLEKKLSYGRIKRIVNVSKGTLSRWLKDYPLSKKRISELRDKNIRRIERFRKTMDQKKRTRLSLVLKQEKERCLPLSKSDFYLAGLFLYWGEGRKADSWTVSLNNSDPKMIKFFYLWLTKSLLVSKDKIKVSLHLYKDMIMKDEFKFWVKVLNLPRSQFMRPYIKRSNRSGITHKGFGHGVCGLLVNDTRLKEKVMMSLKAIADAVVNN